MEWSSVPTLPMPWWRRHWNAPPFEGSAHIFSTMSCPGEGRGGTGSERGRVSQCCCRSWSSDLRPSQGTAICRSRSRREGCEGGGWNGQGGRLQYVGIRRSRWGGKGGGVQRRGPRWPGRSGACGKGRQLYSIQWPCYSVRFGASTGLALLLLLHTHFFRQTSSSGNATRATSVPDPWDVADDHFAEQHCSGH